MAGDTTPAPAAPAAGAPFATVVAPLDGSPTAEAVLPRAKSLVDALGARLVLVRVVPYPEAPPGRSPTGPGPRGGDLPDDVAGAERDARGYLADVVARHALGPAVATVVEVGDPFARIRATVGAQPRPLVVLTTRATAVLPLAEHSVLARRLVFSGIAPVLVLPPEEDGSNVDPRP